MSTRKERQQLFASFMNDFVTKSAISKKELRKEFEKRYPLLMEFYDALFSQYKATHRGKMFTGCSKVYRNSKESASKFKNRLSRNEKRAEKKMVADSRKEYKVRRDNFFWDGFKETGSCPSWVEWAEANKPKKEVNPKAHKEPSLR